MTYDSSSTANPPPALVCWRRYTTLWFYLALFEFTQPDRTEPGWSEAVQRIAAYTPVLTLTGNNALSMQLAALLTKGSLPTHHPFP